MVMINWVRMSTWTKLRAIGLKSGVKGNHTSYYAFGSILINVRVVSVQTRSLLEGQAQNRVERKKPFMSGADTVDTSGPDYLNPHVHTR